jgi:hypothetical protein
LQAPSLCSGRRNASHGHDAAHRQPRRGSSGLGSRAKRGADTHGGGGRNGGAARGGDHSQRGRAAGVTQLNGQGRGRKDPAGALSRGAWLQRAERADTAGGGALVRLSQDLERVPAGEAVAVSARAVQAVEAMLERACACELPPSWAWSPGRSSGTPA